MIAPAVAFALALVCFAGTALIGVYISTRLPPAIDRAGMHLRGYATPFGAFFTMLGRTYAVVALTALAGATALALGRSATTVLVLFGVQVLSQGGVAIVKAVVRRDRPERWLLRLEGDSSFPSGHATTSIVFFIGLIPVIVGWHVGSAATFAAAAVLAACAAGIAWSRLALAAHYVTDVTGGILFGTGCLLATTPFLSHQ